jgi:hypothetical protein
MDRKEIEQLYTSKGFEYRATPQDMNEADFFERSEGKEIRHRLDKVVRTKVGNKEYVLYAETLLTEDKLGNILNYPVSGLRGKYQKPTFTMEWDTELRKEVARSLVGHKTEYEIPFSKQNMQDVLNINTEDENEPSFVLLVGSNARYGGFTADEFLNKSYDELVTKATTGEYPKNPKQQEQQEQQQRRPIREIKKGLIIEEKTAEPKQSEEGEGDKEYAKMEEKLGIQEEEKEHEIISQYPVQDNMIDPMEDEHLAEKVKKSITQFKQQPKKNSSSNNRQK